MKEEDGKVVVEEIIQGSSADISGVQRGDITIALNGGTLKESFDLVYAINQYVSGVYST